MTSQQIPRKPNAEEGFCEPNDLELRFWMTRGQQDTGSAMQRTRKVRALFVHCTYCDVDSASWEVEEDELCRIHIENLHFVGFFVSKQKNYMIIYIIGMLWISVFIWHRAIDIWSILLADRISRTHPDRLLNSSWPCVLTSQHIHCSALCTVCIFWPMQNVESVCEDKEYCGDVVSKHGPSLHRTRHQLLLRKIKQQLRTKAQGWMGPLWIVRMSNQILVCGQHGCQASIICYPHHRIWPPEKSYSEDVIDKLLKPMQ